MTSFDSFVTKVSRNYNTYTEKEWQEADKEFTDFTEVEYVKYESIMTEEETGKVNSLIGKYEAYKLKAGLGGLKNQISNSIQQGAAMLKEIASDSSNGK
jgi:cell division protein FtsL